ncbi:MAG: hypothetical protein ACJAXY_002580 [Nonlabens sp.]|jgi:hypothetical protein
MSSKINVGKIYYLHFCTLTNNRTKKISKFDIFTFLVVPLLVSATFVILKLDLSFELISAIITFSAIFSGLLMNVLVLVYDQSKQNDNEIKQYKQNKRNKEHVSPKDENNFKVKKKVLTELYNNITYTILNSVFIVILSLLLILAKKDGWYVAEEYLINPLVIFVTVNVFLTAIMTVKRLHALLDN